jgi:acyl-CoA reductase-like NAD-dependent aldehyde dehydrogenase
MNDQSKAALTAPLGDLDMYIGGEWVSARSGKRMDVVNPATGKAVGTVPEGAREDAQRAIAAAAEAEDVLRWMTPHERSAMCKRVVESLKRHRG